MIGTSRLALGLVVVFALPGCEPPGTIAVPTTRSATPTVTEEAVTLQSVRLKELREAVKRHEGKIVVVDIWATWCIECRKEFPGLIELHRKHKGEKVVCMSMTVDEEKARSAALKFLQSQKATFANYLLDEPGDVWQTEWHMKGIPVVLVYGRDGKLARKFDYDDPDNQFTYADVNKFVDQLLAAGK